MSAMSSISFVQASSSDDHQALTASLFLLVVLLTVGITFWASRNTKTAADYYAGGRSFSGVQNLSLIHI